ncbi:hypothetical protein ACIO52_02870 [Nocardia sp. NPDC087230]|uniref:hypothetical protein n=1 Tax=Nocardia sp. NPDC087230 TaxID=3364331 RepID=UPI0037FE1C5B
MFHRARHHRPRRRSVAARTRRARTRWVRVYLGDIDTIFFGYTPDKPLSLADRFALDISMRDADLELLQRILDDHVLLDRVFAALNGHPNHGDEALTDHWYGLGHRSLSVGDVLALGSRHYACTPTGWRHVPPPRLARTTTSTTSDPGSPR